MIPGEGEKDAARISMPVYSGMLSLMGYVFPSEKQVELFCLIETEQFFFFFLQKHLGILKKMSKENHLALGIVTHPGLQVLPRFYPDYPLMPPSLQPQLCFCP